MLYYLAIYLGFLLLVSGIYYSVKNEYKYLVLFAVSLGVITYFSWIVAVYAILFSTFNYAWGILIEKHKKNDTWRLRLFWSAIISDIAFLSFFKYNGLLDDGIKGLLSIFSANSQLTLSSIILPLGISYYTFQALGYIIRINRGSEKAEHEYLKFVIYLIFFPKFFSGPVERSNRFFPQIHNLENFNKDSVSDGIRLLFWGAFKKFALAYALYFPVHQVYSDIKAYTGVQLILVFFVQTVYIYMDFSGYTDMALGTAKILGIKLTNNFNRPFLSRNISEFWRRWHISLSSWCTDFIYNPFIVKYRRYENFAVVAGVFITFFTIGIWHDANWTFIILGLLQAIAIVYEFYTKKERLKIASGYSKSLVNTLSRIIVFIFMSFSMVFFFSPTISDAWYLISHLFSFTQTVEVSQTLISQKIPFFLALGCFVLIFVAEMLNEKGKNIPAVFLKQPIWVQAFSYGVLVLAIYLSDSTFIPFEYMRF
ncbi:MAG: MBOAT family O-acyltransferase [Bacteroidales bacterium]|nr:MBOAT family O-acyltransferase [Bacteroidales bacterium]